jgi:hypothetical protein
MLAVLCLGLMAGSAGAASPETNAVLAGFGDLEWIAGINAQDATNTNQSEWLPEYEGALATEVNLSEPHSAMADLSGNVYIADKNAHAIRRITRDGRIHTVAGTNVAGFNGDGPALTRQLSGPQHCYPMPDGSFYIMDTGNQRIRKVSVSGQMTTVIAENSGMSRGMWVKRDESVIYYCSNTAVKRWAPALGTGGGVVISSGFSELGNLDVTLNGDVYVTDRGAVDTDPTAGKVFRLVPATGAWTRVLVAGAGGGANSGPAANGTPATTVGLVGVRGIAFHPAGGYFLATHRGGDIWYVDSAGEIQMAVRGDNGNTHTTAPQALPVTANSIAEPRAVSVAPNGDLLMATNDAGFIRRARYIGPVPEPAALTLTRPVTPGGLVKLTWTPPAGPWFRLESTADPATELWTPRQVAAGTGALIQWTESATTAAQPRQSYRLRQFRAWPN